MATKRKTLTKSLHTVTAVSRLAAHLYRERLSATINGGIEDALVILGQPKSWPIGDETFNRCAIATHNLLGGK